MTVPDRVKQLDRLPPLEDPIQIPERDEGSRRATVDVSWGEIKPLRAAPGVETVAELELSSALEDGALLVDTRSPAQHAEGTIPGARNVPQDEIVERSEELGDGEVVLFCNGPQCPATPTAIERLLEAGHDASTLRYYRGGMHDWVTLGLPVAAGE